MPETTVSQNESLASSMKLGSRAPRAEPSDRVAVESSARIRTVPSAAAWAALTPGASRAIVR